MKSIGIFPKCGICQNERKGNMKKSIKKILCTVVAAATAVTLFAGCNKKSDSSTLTYYVLGSETKDTQMVFDEVNKQLEEKTGLKVDFKFLSNDNYDLILSSGDPYDLITTPDWLNYWGNAAKGAFAEITDDDLKKNAPYVWEKASDILNYSKYKGVRYGIPNMHRYASNRCIVARGDLMDKYGIKDLDSNENIEKYLTAVAENEKGMIPFDMNGNNDFSLVSMFANDWGWAPVGSLSFAEPFYYRLDDPEHKLFIAVEQPEMLEYTKTMKRWNDKGFFSKSVLSNKTSSLESFKAGKSALALVGNLSECQNTWTEISKDERVNWDIRFYAREHHRQQMDGMLNGNVAISAFSTNKDNALKVVNEIYSNKELYLLLSYGIEGVHYALEDGMYVPKDSEAYVAPMSGIANDEFSPESKLTFPGCQELSAKLESNKVVNPLVNCPISDEGIREIKIAVSEVREQYSLPRGYGIFNGTAEEALAEELNALKTAGIDKYMQSVQEQANSYLESISE